MTLSLNARIVSAAIAATLCFTPVYAQEEGQGENPSIHMISPELMEAIGAWSEPSTNLKDVALLEPEAIIAYASELEGIYGTTLDVHLSKTYPEAFAEYTDLVGEATDSADLLAYFMSHREDDFLAQQSERGVAGEGLTFETFIEREFPHLIEEADAANITPADEGMSFQDFLVVAGLDQLQAQASALTDPIDWTPDPCRCTTVVTFDRSPTNWILQRNEQVYQTWGWPKKVKDLDFTVAAHGAGKDASLTRHTKHNMWNIQRPFNNSTHMSVRLLCTENGTPGGVLCGGTPCTADLDLRVQYGSRVFEQVQTGGAWSKRAQSIAADSAIFSHDPPGPAPRSDLFTKGVAVSGDTKTGWSAQSALQILSAAAQIGVAVAADGTTAASLLEGDLLADTFNAVVGLITRQGSETSNASQMKIAWDTAGSSALNILPNRTYRFELDSESMFLSNGYGGDSKTWGRVDSSHLFAGVMGNIQCQAGTFAPDPSSFWFYRSGAEAPNNMTTLSTQAGNWIQTHLGVRPGNIGSPLGQYP